MWTNTCCSHPLVMGDEMKEENAWGVRLAAQRKVNSELGQHNYIIQRILLLLINAVCFCFLRILFLLVGVSCFCFFWCIFSIIQFNLFILFIAFCFCNISNLFLLFSAFCFCYCNLVQFVFVIQCNLFLLYSAFYFLQCVCLLFTLSMFKNTPESTGLFARTFQVLK